MTQAIVSVSPGQVLILIEHGLSPHLTRMIFRTWQTVRPSLSKAGMATGLEVEVSILETMDLTGRKCIARVMAKIQRVGGKKGGANPAWPGPFDDLWPNFVTGKS